MYIGRGGGARVAPWTDREGIDGARLLVRTDARSALALAVEALTRARFTSAAPELQARLEVPGSPWVAHGLTIGRPSSSSWWRTHNTGFDEVPLHLLPPFWPRVAFTLAIACARATDAGSELVFVVHPSWLRAGDRVIGTRPLLSSAYDSMRHGCARSGILQGHGTIDGVADAACPASADFVWKVLGWR